LDTKDFLTRVTAQRDEIVICCLTNGVFWNRGSYASIDEAADAIEKWDREQNTTVYYSVGNFADHIETVDGKKKIRRHADKATWFKTLALDLDIGPDKPYQTQKEGNTHLQNAVAAIGLPAPTLISSGNGIHAYWPLTQVISSSQWERISIALRLALSENDVKIDTSKIHDTSMVLRPVGSNHKKQTPWKPVKCVYDSGEHDIVELAKLLKPWFNKALPLAGKTTKSGKAGKKKSSIAAAVMQTNDINVILVAKNCRQIAALINSAGVSDAAGDPVEEPMWRASLGIAKYAIEPDVAIELLAGGHPDFDLDKNLDKMDGWNGTGPTTCAEFERHCSSGCDGCPFRGQVKSPAQLSYVATPDPANLPAPDAEVTFAAPTTYPVGYSEVGGGLGRQVPDDSGNGNMIITKFCDYLMHVTNIFRDPVANRISFTLAVRCPHIGWQLEDHDVNVLSASGKDFSMFLLNRQVFIGKAGQQETVRQYLMDYLSKVQSETPNGIDFISFGWQKDGSFLCGEKVINSPNGSINRRLKGPASRFADIIKTHGSRDQWVRGMNMLNNPGSDTIRSAILVATAGILGPAAGNASMVLSIYSTETTTGKTLALVGANSLIGSPRELFMNKNDTANALFKVRGVLNNLPCTIDELTAADDRDVVNLAYDLSQGREKLAMDKNRDLREPVKWDGPTLITTNISLHQKFEIVQANNDPLKARTFEIHQHDRTFIQPDPFTGISPGNLFFDLMAENNGWAYPELVEAVVAMGGAKAVWQKGEQAFMRKFGFVFEPPERFYRTAIIGGWVMGNIGKRLGLFPFDVDATAKYLLKAVTNMRNESASSRYDVFDIVGQYLQENNDKLIEVTEVYGSGKEQVRLPAPDRAVARVKIVHDSTTQVLPGSSLAVNAVLFKDWLQRRGDSADRIARELLNSGALISKKDRITMFKGCLTRNPGQTHCMVINLNHPRFVESLTGGPTKTQSPITLAILNTAATP
jgi:hypothetical protein